MENRKIPALIALAGVVIALVVFFFVIDDDTADQETETTVSEETSQPEDENASSGSDKPDKPDKPEDPLVPLIEIKGGEPVGGALELEVPQGDGFELAVTTDTADELHLHGYELYFDIEPGETNKIKVPATDIGTGIVELESHSTGVVLAEISVVPS